MDDDDTVGEAPDVRPIPEVLAAMRAVAAGCAGIRDAEAVRGDLRKALSLMLELRVPRMPETDEELAQMLRRSADDGPGIPSEQVFRDLDRHMARFTRFLEDYDRLLAEGDWEAAAAALLSPGGAAGPSWEGGAPTIEVTMEGDTAVATAKRDGDWFGTEGVDRGSAMLAAVMQAHDRWRDAWMR